MVNPSKEERRTDKSGNISITYYAPSDQYQEIQKRTRQLFGTSKETQAFLRLCVQEKLQQLKDKDTVQGPD